MAPPKKHHFLPVFYLKQWTGETDTLVEFGRPYGNVVKPRRVHPAATGYINRLYAIDGLPDDAAQKIETEFLSPIDSRAAEAQKLLLSEQSLTSAQRHAWAQYIATLMLRMPDDILTFKASLKDLYESIIPTLEALYDRIRRTSDDQFDQVSNEIIASAPQEAMLKLPEIMSNKRIIDGILKMKWFVLYVRNYDFITSDRPVIFDAPFNSSQGWLACPISPHHLFFAHQSEEIITQLRAAPPQTVRSKFNGLIASSSQRLAYARNDQHLRFIQKRMNSIDTFNLSIKFRETFNNHIPSLKEAFSKFDNNEFFRQLYEHKPS